MNIVIFGGDFNPIHNGHLNMAIKASKHLNADVYFVPAVISVWKNESINFELKVEMIRNTITGYKRLYIDEWENSTNKKINYTIDTIKYFKNKFPNDKLFLLIGNDQVNNFHKWKKCFEISKIVQIVYFERPTFNLDNENVTKFKMKKIPGKEKNISSSQIRNGERFDVSENIFSIIEKNELYFIKEVKKLLTEKRFLHSLSVAHLSYEIAKANKIRNFDKAYLAGLFHDIGKDIPLKESEKIMVENFKKELSLPYFAYHQFVGTYILKVKFNIYDSQILNAIKYHATGNAKMSTLAKIIYASDKIEPTRGYDSKDMIDECLKNIKDGFILVLKANRKFLLSKNKDIDNKFTKKCFEYYLK